MFTAVALAGKTRSAYSIFTNFFLLLFARLPYKQTGAFLIVSIIVSTLFFSEQDRVLALAVEHMPANLITENFVYEKQEVPFQVKRIPDNTLLVGETKVIQPGRKGLIQKKVRSLSFNGSLFTKDIVGVERKEPTNQLVSFGTKKIYSSLDTPKGPVTYWAKLRMFSTSYDSRCPGCNETTAIGMKAGYGVVAVDPKVIPLRTKVYIPGYGFAVAGDTGGAIKGNKIDLGFDDVRKGWWSARYTDVYLLSE